MTNSLFPHTIIRSIKERLLEKSETVSVAESVTSGMLQLAFSTAENAIYFFQGGITTYNIGQKARHLYIDPIYASTCNCVSEKTATEMALSVSIAFTSHWGIAVTGYASPVPESGNKLFAWYAITYQGKVMLAKKISTQKSNPLKIQSLYCREILKSFKTFVHKKK